MTVINRALCIKEHRKAVPSLLAISTEQFNHYMDFENVKLRLLKERPVTRGDFVLKPKTLL